MALQFVVGDATITLSREDIDKHPGSLLHSLVGSVTSSDGPVSFKVDALPDSPLAAWPAAVGITTAVYRHGYIEAEILSGLLTKHTTADLYDKLKDLIDYLLLPGPVTKYLPSQQQVPLRYARALDLHYQAAANNAVEAILSSTVFSNPGICKDIGENRAAFFYLPMLCGSDAISEGEVVNVQVYAVGDTALSRWKPPAASASTTSSSLAGPAAGGTAPVNFIMTYAADVIQLPQSPNSTTQRLCNILSGARAGNPVAIPLDHAQLVPMIQLGLEKGLAAANLELDAGGSSMMTVTHITASLPIGQYSETLPLWVVHW